MKLKQLCGDVGNTNVNAHTNELVYLMCGKEFGPNLEGKTVVNKRALNGLRARLERWLSHFAGLLGFNNAWYDKDVWHWPSKCRTHYKYECTHSDDLIIAEQELHAIINSIKEAYDIKNERLPDHYLGNDFKQDSKDWWCFGCKHYYLKEALL